jgi:hypothetical protein
VASSLSGYGSRTGPCDFPTIKDLTVHHRVGSLWESLFGAEESRIVSARAAPATTAPGKQAGTVSRDIQTGRARPHLLRPADMRIGAECVLSVSDHLRTYQIALKLGNQLCSTLGFGTGWTRLWH